MQYLDNISRTTLSQAVIKEVSENLDTDFDEKIDRNLRKACGITVNDWDIIFTTGREQSNEIIISYAVESYKIEVGTPHLIVSAAEHTSMISLLKKLKRSGLDITFIPTDLQGTVIPEMVERYIKPNTCLISIIFVQEDTGAINNIKAIGEIAYKNNIPFHTDGTQYFAHISRVNMRGMKLNAMSIDASAFHGPKGVGALIVDQNLIDGYKMEILKPTINTGLIHGMMKAVVNPKLRATKTEIVGQIRRLIIRELDKRYKKNSPEKYKRGVKYTPKEIEYVLISPEKGAMIPHILTFGIIPGRKKFSADIFAKELLEDNIFINLPSKFVLEKMGFKESFASKVLRISFGGDTRISSIKKLLTKLFNKFK